jgi:Arc/MetJ-type ribon-helix-helix transcriptional regulator
MTIQIAVRLPQELVEEVDRLVERGRHANRTDAVRVALERLVARAREAELDEAIVAGYRATPDDHELDAWAAAELRAMVEEEPW